MHNNAQQVLTAHIQNQNVSNDDDSTEKCRGVAISDDVTGDEVVAAASASEQNQAQRKKKFMIIMNGPMASFLHDQRQALGSAVDKMKLRFQQRANLELLMNVFEVWGREIMPALVDSSDDSSYLLPYSSDTDSDDTIDWLQLHMLTHVQL